MSGARTDTTGQDEDARLARAVLTHLAEPSHPLLQTLLAVLKPTGVLAVIRAGSLPASAAAELRPALAQRFRAALPGWRDQLADIRIVSADLRCLAERGVSLICPGDSDWPVQLGDLGAAAPLALWV